MNTVLAGLVVLGFAWTIESLSLPDRAREVGERARQSLTVLRDNSLTDRQKEQQLQQQAKQLFVLLGILLGGSGLALGGPLLCVWILGKIGVGSFHGVLGVLQRIDFLIATILLGVPIYSLVRYLRKR